MPEQRNQEDNREYRNSLSVGCGSGQTKNENDMPRFGAIRLLIVLGDLPLLEVNYRPPTAKHELPSKVGHLSPMEWVKAPGAGAFATSRAGKAAGRGRTYHTAIVRSERWRFDSELIGSVS